MCRALALLLLLTLRINLQVGASCWKGVDNVYNGGSLENASPRPSSYKENEARLSNRLRSGMVRRIFASNPG